MQTIMKRIVEWGKSLPYWEQMALDRIIAGEPFTDDDYEQLLQFLLEDEGLGERVRQRDDPRFYQLIDHRADETSSIRLRQISNLNNINALVENQTLTFCEGLTTIYGENGSGKSGYARILASAAFTRGDREVLPNINRPKSKAGVLSAEITILKDGAEQVIHYKVNQRCPELSSFYVFDSTSVRVHMNEQNPLSFSPAGLNYLKELAIITDQVRARLSKKIESLCQVCEYEGLFLGESAVSHLVSNIGPDTDLGQLEALATLSPEEKKRSSELAIQIANIELDKVKNQISTLNNRIHAIEEAVRTLKIEMEALSDERLGLINQLLLDYIKFEEATKAEGIDTFKNPRLISIGSPEWNKMVRAARELVMIEGNQTNEYPQPGDICLLCQQPLSTKANELIHMIWLYLRGQAHESLVKTQGLLENNQNSLQTLRILSSGIDLPIIRHLLGDEGKELVEPLSMIICEYEKRYSVINSCLISRQVFQYSPILTTILSDIDNLIRELINQRNLLESLNIEQECQVLEAEKRELDHRIVLGQVYEKIKNYIERIRWARDASKVGGSTHHITSMHNSMFKELVTDEYVRLFEKTLKLMGRPLKVKITTIGKKGQTLKQITLETDPDAKDIAKPEKILSEGEKRAVALADFLTEVELDASSSGIILDDPVTSLDLEWRGTIAQMLVEKAKSRQVIIFTHDLPFLYYLKNNSEKSGIPIATHWIKRGDSDGQPGYVFLDNSPALEKEYKKATKARNLHQKSLSAEAEYQEFLLREGFGALRTTYEAFIIFDLFEEVVMRFDERISFGRLKSIRWESSLVDEVVESCERLSRYIEGHLHSDAFSGGKPTPSMLIGEIERFENLQKRLKALKPK